MKNKLMFIINIAFISGIFVLNYFYQSNNFDFTLKCICSGSFALLGIINLCYALRTKQDDKSFFIWMTLGLFLAFLGDVLIRYDFIVGAATFALGHICFIVAYCYLERFRKSDIVISMILFAGTLVFLLTCPLLRFEEAVFRVVCVLYGLIISVMLGKAAGNFVRNRNTVTATIFIASVLFFFSDLMLVFDRFIGLWSWTDNACMATYYPALCLLALSVFLKTKSKASA